jgi:hypothetical protein
MHASFLSDAPATMGGSSCRRQRVGGDSDDIRISIVTMTLMIHLGLLRSNVIFAKESSSRTDNARSLCPGFLSRKRSPEETFGLQKDCPPIIAQFL